MKTILTIELNGEEQDFLVLPKHTLLEVLRDQANLLGTKEGCNIGTCGTCTVLLDGKPVLSCLTLAITCQNMSVITIEGISKNNEMSVMQQAFLKHGAVQCGYCTPGMILSATALVDEHPKPTVKQTQKALEGNLCRCTGYNAIINAVMDATGHEEEPKF